MICPFDCQLVRLTSLKLPVRLGRFARLTPLDLPVGLSTCPFIPPCCPPAQLRASFARLTVGLSFNLSLCSFDLSICPFDS
ncbi:MAG: hypothetical protein PHR96_02920 [Clostridia bacterium]|nr:hypothetical protein [Clostridia bacterium]